MFFIGDFYFFLEKYEVGLGFGFGVGFGFVSVIVSVSVSIMNMYDIEKSEEFM